MAVSSRINPNFPIPGIDQSSRGFRDNFATIKTEIENIQSKNIQLVGSLISQPVQIGNGVGDIIIPVEVSLSNIQASGSNLSVQYNFNNIITGSQMYYNNGSVGIGTSLPTQTLEVIGNVAVLSPSGHSMVQMGNLFAINAYTDMTTMGISNVNVVVINNANLTVGIGSAPHATLDIWSDTNDVMIVRALLNNQDNSIRYTTSQPNSTVGLAFEQRTTNRVGGIRMDQTGIVTLHAGEDMDANLSNASRVITILPDNNVGIGSTAPRNTLDVGGNTYIEGTLIVGQVPAITGSVTDGSALTNLLNALSTMGLIINNTTP